MSAAHGSANTRGKLSFGWLMLGISFLVWREALRAQEAAKVAATRGGSFRTNGRINMEVPPMNISDAGVNWKRDESWKDALSGLRDRPHFNLSDPLVLQYADLLEGMLSVFGKIDGIKDGMGHTGMVSHRMLKMMGSKPQFMSCAGHIRIVDGKVYFRYGGFITTWYRLRRFNQSIKMLQDAVNWYGLQDLRVEFFFNTCDMPMSFDNILSTSNRAGYCMFSTQAAVGTTDIIVPDPLDLAPDYMPDTANQVPWEEKKDKAIFRGASTNYDLKEYTWRASPRLRLHRMSDLRPDLMDAKIMRWSHIKEDELDLIEADGVRLGKRVNHRKKNTFKYEIVVDGGVGTCRTCGLLASNQAMIRQASGFKQFFEPLLKPGVHYLPTEHHFQDLPDTIDWARHHDQQVKKMVENANEIAKWVCTWEGRTLYWAIALAKYAEKALDDTVKVEKPEVLCGGKEQKPILDVYHGYKKGIPRCGGPTEYDEQPQCVHWCIYSLNPESKWLWLSSDVFENLERLGPHQ